MPSIDVSNIAYGATGDGTTDDTAAILAAIAAASPGDTIAFPTGTYKITDVIYMNALSSLTLSGTSATIKCAASYDGYQTDGVYGLLINGCTDITLTGLTFDANKANNATEFVHTRIEGSSVTASSCVWKNSNYHAIWISGASNVSVSDCDFTDNCTDAGTDSDVYASNENSVYSFSDCTFERTRESAAQAFYMGEGTGTYTNNTFTGPATAYDFRNGTHAINGSNGTVGTAVITQVGTPYATATGLVFDIDTNRSVANFVDAVAAFTGTLIVSDSTFTATTADAWHGARAYGYSSKLVLARCSFTNFNTHALYIGETSGGHIIKSCTLGCDGSGTGVYSERNRGAWHLAGNTITGCSVELNNRDGYARSHSSLQSATRTTGARLLTAADSQSFSSSAAIAPGTSDFWFSLWVKRTSSDAAQSLVELYSGTGDLSILLLQAATSVRVWIAATSYTFSSAGISNAIWKHCALNFDRDENLTLYVNGIAVGASDISAQSAVNVRASNATWGRFGCTLGAAQYLDGALSRMAYGTGLLTATEVAYLYNHGKGLFYSEILDTDLDTKIVHYWDTDEASGSAIDAKGENDFTASVSEPTVVAGPRESITPDKAGDRWRLWRKRPMYLR
jgi:hypothetical protein